MNNTYIAQAYGKSLNYTDIPNNLFKKYDVKKGLRNEDGTGVRVGLTRVSDVVGYDYADGRKIGIPGELYYRGYRINDLVEGKGDSHYGYEETCFLLLFGYLPDKPSLSHFSQALKECYTLPDDFLEMNFLRMPSKNIMNLMQSVVLSLYNYDETPDNLDVYETLLKGMNIIAKLPSITCYGYQSQNHYFKRQSLVIHYPREDYSIAENILYMMREDREFTAKEASMLDTLLMLHADHGGGNNSTFTNVVISSTGTDIYSTVAGSIGSMKGPRHGGANIYCFNMLKTIAEEIGYDAPDDKLRGIFKRILNKDYFDKSGLIYGLGHAVYTVSDPRAEILKVYCEELATEKGRLEEFEFLKRFEVLAKEALFEATGKTVSNNVDLFSGFAYDMLQIPKELFTPLFVCSRMGGWLAHNIENKMYDGRIMRPATMYVGEKMDYTLMKER